MNSSPVPGSFQYTVPAMMPLVLSTTMPAGGGAVFETVFDADASGEGLYPFVTHAFADAEKGAVGMIRVGTPKQFATMSH